MSSINTTFQPLTDLLVVDSTGAAQISGASQRGVSSFRVVCRGTAAAYLAWGRKAAGLVATAPIAVGTVPSNNNGGIIGLVPGVPCYIEVPPDSFFIGSAVFATSAIEITGGIGGVGG